MISDVVKARILLSVANGATLAEAARFNGVKPEQARNAIHRICRSRSLGRGQWLPSQVSDIQSSPQKYIDFASKIIGDSRFTLREALRAKLVGALSLRAPDDLTPGYVSNIAAEMLLENGFTSIAVAEIQEWLVSCGSSLKCQAISDIKYVRQAKQAAFLLSAFGFKVGDIVAHLNEIEG